MVLNQINESILELTNIDQLSDAEMVRIVLKPNVNYLIECEKLDDVWIAQLPFLIESEISYHVECVIDGKYIKIEEGALGADITGQYAPNNKLLKPEFEVKQSHTKIPSTEPLDELIDLEELGDDVEVTPGSGKQYAQKSNTENAKSIIDKLIGNRKMDNEHKKGSLFKRDVNGRIIVPGIN